MNNDSTILRFLYNNRELIYENAEYVAAVMYSKGHVSGIASKDVLYVQGFLLDDTEIR